MFKCGVIDYVIKQCLQCLFVVLLWVLVEVVECCQCIVVEVVLWEVEMYFCLLINVFKEYVVFLFDFQGIVCIWNVVLCGIFGYVCEDILGKLVEILYLQVVCEVGEFQCKFECVCCEGSFIDDCWMLCKDGMLFYVLSVVIVIYNEMG